MIPYQPNQMPTSDQHQQPRMAVIVEWLYNTSSSSITIRQWLGQVEH